MISNLAVIETTHVGHNVTIHEFAVIRSDVIIGNEVVIHPHVVINSGVVIGDGVEVFPGAYIGKEPKGAGALARQPVFERRVLIGKGTSIGPHAVIYYDVEIGEQTLIGDSVSIREQCRIGAFSIVGRHVTINYTTTIGNRVKIMDLSWLAGNMKIGDDVFISGGVMTANDNQIGAHGYNEEQVRGPTIEDGARIGVGAIILPRLIVGKKSLIGAGCLVTKDVEHGTFVKGLPSRLVDKVG